MTAAGRRRVRPVALAALATIGVGAAVAVGIAQGGSGGGNPDPAPSSPSPAWSGTPEQPSPTIVATGETVDVPVAGDPAVLLRLTVHSLEVTATCPGRATATQRPSHEAFVVLELTASLRAKGGEPVAGDAAVRLGAESFQVLDDRGELHELTATDEAWACLEPEELLPPFVTAADPARGAIVLDSTSTRGVVVYAPAGAAGWGWEF
jgi:hypothetical protein